MSLFIFFMELKEKQRKKKRLKMKVGVIPMVFFALFMVSLIFYPFLSLRLVILSKYLKSYAVDANATAATVLVVNLPFYTIYSCCSFKSILFFAAIAAAMVVVLKKVFPVGSNGKD